MKTRHVQGVIAGQMICLDNAVGHNHLLDDRQQGHAFGIRNGCRIHFSTAFQHPENRDFSDSWESDGEEFDEDEADI